MEATTIEGVIANLDEIIALSKANSSRLGYFAALYRKVTIRVKEGIAQGEFEDGPRMEALDVRFANRYITAFDAYQHGQPVTQSWQVAFEMGEQWWPIVLQHLLVGMNAHINLDLGIAAARTAPGAALADLEHDFNKINAVLAELVDGVKRELEQVWPRLVWIDRLANKAEDVIVNFSMEQARKEAWHLAQQLAPLDEVAQAAVITKRDAEVAELGRFVAKPDVFMGSVVLGVIRLGELGSVPEIIDLLC